MDQLEEILERMKNHSTNLCRNAETPETSRDSDVCPICEDREWILKIKDGVEIAVPCKAVAICRYTGGISWDGSEVVSNGCVQEAGK